MSPLFVSDADVNSIADPAELISETQRHQGSSSPQSNQNHWHPTKQSLLFATIAISPFVSIIIYKMGRISIFYLSILLFITGPLAIQVQDRRTLIRWICGIVTVIFLSGIKTSTFLTQMEEDGLLVKVLFYAFTALWECSNVVLIFGGRTFLERYGITNHYRAFITCLCPVQMKFTDSDTVDTDANGPLRRDKYIKRSVHITSYIGAFFIFRLLFRQFVNTIESVPILEAEAIVILVSCSVHFWNIPPHLWQLFMLRQPVQIIYPYGSIYFSSSSREFWRKWSRPASALVRHMFYYPMGGANQYPYLSIPLMFFMNASSHYDVSNALVGDRSEVGWNLVFGTLGLVATLEVVGDKFMNNGSARNNSSISASPAQVYVDTGSDNTASIAFDAGTNANAMGNALDNLRHEIEADSS